MRIGPTGSYPFDAPKTPFDRGGLFSAVYVVPGKRLIAVAFGTVVSWLAITPEGARMHAARFRKIVIDHWGDLPYNVDELPLRVVPRLGKGIVEIYMPEAVELLAANPELFLALAQRLDEAAAAF